MKSDIICRQQPSDLIDMPTNGMDEISLITFFPTHHLHSCFLAFLNRSGSNDLTSS